ncbi:hypothetical protein AARAC_004698 [Aspergillus arachidicola]|uniref:Saccharopine dehydrogenase NADP binding domain-containing protein n=1 Tax=Aspergillus arachidicola TaxID=656916 RepID=A0A2G7G044_9EURO|nr:hypothetical protein AARAC_004698 [Aspergillus arachidicola]
MSPPVVFLGAAGQMCEIVVQRFAQATGNPLVLTDINIGPVEKLRDSLPAGRATSQRLDIFDPSALLEVIKGAALVVLAAGPYTRTSKPVISACLEAKVPYLDFDDDVESTLAALDLDETAKKAGIPCYIGCGASPGMSNVMVVDATRGLDTVDGIDVCWLVGHGKAGAGKAVLEHLMHISAGPCLTWVGGKPVLNETYLETGYAPMIGDTEMLLHETAHPEPVTLPRLFPNATRIKCLGGLHPPTKWGFARGLGAAVRRGALPMADAVDFQYNARLGKVSPNVWIQMLRDYLERVPGVEIANPEISQRVQQAARSRGPWDHALNGMIEQVHNGECTKEEVADYLISVIGGGGPETINGLLVRAIGTRNGHPAVVTKRTPTVGIDSYLLRSMATLTGTSCAAFALMALNNTQAKNGVFSPEDWAEPSAFYEALRAVGTPAEELVEDYSHC